ncbi:hypothetical protein DL93DRAFT_1879976 [Clavulina sp. PMI_390]|nr:hypothetical protein DL93DRAFT_1879976 [Clavulina sp. PMI_390]
MGLCRQHEDTILRDLMLMNPSYLFGPIFHFALSPETPQTSHQAPLDAIKTEEALTPESVWDAALVEWCMCRLRPQHIYRYSLWKGGWERLLMLSARWSTEIIYG